jgi:hypothetical protein
VGPKDWFQPGGIAAAHRLLTEHGRHLEADLRHHYHGLDLRDLWRPAGGRSRLTYRLLLVLYDGLPGESLTKTAIRDTIPDDQLAELSKRQPGRHGPWSHVDLLVAALIDQVVLLRRDTAALHGAKLNGDFEPYPRPGVARKRRRALSAEGLAYLQRMRREHELANGYGAGAGTG